MLNQTLTELAALLEEVERRKKYNRIKYVFPDEGEYSRDKYAAAIAFFKAGKDHRARCLIAGNRCGKSFDATVECVYHLTGDYPKWWEGKVFKEPTRIWGAGITNETTKEIIQELLLGSFLDQGSGLIPKADIIKVVNKPGNPECVQSIYVRHRTHGVEDGMSVITLKSYDQGPSKFQGTSQHVIWLDEEPDQYKVWEECFMRTAKTSTFPGGMIMLTFTPLFGLSEVVKNFLPGGRFPTDHVNPANGYWVGQITWDDVPHLDTETKNDLLKGIAPWLREARTKGIPQLGSGAIYPVAESDISVQPFPIPPHWPKVYGMDVAFAQNKTAAVWVAQDPNSNVWYLYDEYYVGREEPPLHARSISARGKFIPGVIDPSSNHMSRTDGSRLLNQYLDLGLNLRMADNSLEAGLTLVWTMLACGQLKVFSTCQNWFTEFRTYHKDDKGKVAANQADDLMDATRYVCMSGLQAAMPNPDYKDTTAPIFFTIDDNGASEVTGY